MSNAPYLLPKARAGYRMGHQEVLDHMFYDGLQNPYDGQMMGHFGEATAKRYGFSREDQDAFAIESVQPRARRRRRPAGSRDEIAPVTVKSRSWRNRRGRRRGAGPVRHPAHSDHAAGVRQGRHGDGRHLLVDLRRRGRRCC